MDNIDVINACVGVDNDRYTKSAVVISTELYKDKELVNTIFDNAMDKPIVDITLNQNYIIVDLDFISKFDTDLKITYKQILQHFENVNKDTENEYHTLTLTIVPKELEGKYYMVLINPIFVSLSAKNPDEDCSIIKFAFEESSFFIYENEDETVDSIQNEIKTEIEKDNFIE